MKHYVAAALLTLFGAGVLVSYMTTGVGGFWFELDSSVFWYFNEKLVPGSAFLSFAAYTNARLFDVVSFAAMAGLYFCHFVRADATEKRRMIAIGLLMLLTAVAVKQGGRFLPLEHPSPTLYFEDVNRLSRLTDIGAKDSDGNSFPGDHGMMLMIFAAYMGRYKGLRAFLLASCIAVLFSLPRIMSGAHWFGDIYAGSLSILCMTLSWFLLTPASDRCVAVLSGLLPGRFFR